MSKIITGLASALLALTFASSASAATSAPFQKYVSIQPCVFLDCKLDFPVVPAGKRLDITNVSCYYRGQKTPSTDIYSAQIIVKTKAGGIASAVTLKPAFVSESSAQNYIDFASNDAVFIFAAATQHMQAEVQMTSSGGLAQLACSIGGHLVTL